MIALLTRDGEPGPPPPTPSTLPEYRVVYEVRETAGAEPVVTTEVVEVRRPFDARVETWAGPRGSGDLLALTVTNREHLWHIQQGGKVEFGIVRQPGTAHRDASLVALRDAVEGGAAKESGRSRFLGRDCVRFVYRDTRPSPLSTATATDRVESCVTPDGIALREEWTFRDRVVLTWQAVEVDTSPRLTNASFLMDRTPGSSRDGESPSQPPTGQAVERGNRLGTAVADPRLPEGFVRDRGATLFDSGTGGTAPREAFFESFRRRHEVVVVEQGRTAADGPPWSDAEGSDLDVAEFASSRVVYFQDRVELRMVLEEPDAEGRLRFVIVRAPSLALARYGAGGLDFSE